MNLFGVFSISGSALTAERQRAEVVTANMANAETTRGPDGHPYRRHLVVFRAGAAPPQFHMMLAAYGGQDGPGVRVDQVLEDPSPPVRRYEPGHPDADAQGYVSYPAINPVDEMVDLMGAVRAYELNASALQASKTMILDSLQIIS
jgi:flagellar basal-body rod protein FlgC